MGYSKLTVNIHFFTIKALLLYFFFFKPLLSVKKQKKENTEKKSLEVKLTLFVILN